MFALEWPHVAQASPNVAKDDFQFMIFLSLALGAGIRGVYHNAVFFFFFKFSAEDGTRGFEHVRQTLYQMICLLNSYQDFF